ncbi:MAG: VCBS repeat-containing protein [Eubacterium sp.]
MRSKRIVSFLISLCMVVSTFSAFSYDKAGAAETKTAETDAFGINMDSTFDKNKEKANNPYGTEGWFPLSTISELYVARGNNSNRYFNTYDYNGTNMGDTGSIGNVFSAKSSQGKEEGNKDGYHFMDTAGCDVYGEGQKKYTVTAGYRINGRVMDLFLTDASGNRISNTVTLGTNNTLDYLEEADAYENTGFISVAAGDFDGDGKDSVVVYVPEMKSSESDHKPAIYMFDISGTQLTKKKEITKVYDLLGCGDLSTKRTNNGRVFRNAPVVQLVAADTDKDNVDELIITAGLNHTYDKVEGDNKQSRMFIMDYNKSGIWYTSCTLNTKGYDKYDGAKRLRWAASSVGNISMSNSLVDYPEIITAGWIDKTDGNGKELTHSVGSYMTTCTEVKKNSEGTEIGIYSSTMLNSIESSEFTRGGHFQDDVQCILPVAAFLADGIGKPASVLISDTVYALDEYGDLKFAYRDDYFNDDDDGIGGSIIQNGLVQDVVAGNFDGNEDGREQVIFTTCQKRQSFSQYFNKIYTYQKDKNGNWSKEATDYFFNKKNYVFVSLCALDTDGDSTIVKLEDVERTYTEPEVLAILEAAPYFAEIDGGDTGNSQTAYGKSKSVENSNSISHGLSTQIIAGYESEVFGTGGGFETTIENNFTWETASSTSTEYSLEYANDSGENKVVVYRRPVTTWKYQVKNREKRLYLSRQGELLSSMISVDSYNEIAEQYDLDEITNNIVSEPGNPFSYRSSLAGYENKVLSTDTASYSGEGGTITQSFTYSEGEESSFTYDLSVSFVAYGLIFGVKAGGGAGYNYSNTKTTINTSSITKSGSVTSKEVDGYDFNWRFAHWTTELNDTSVPVLGYELSGVIAPPSPPENLSVSEVAQTTATITWARVREVRMNTGSTSYTMMEA